MKGARERDGACSSSRGARELERALHRFGAGVAKENRIEMRWGAFDERFGKQAAQKRAIHLHHVRQIEIEHIANGLFHDRMIPSNVKNAVAAQEIEIRLIIH